MRRIAPPAPGRPRIPSEGLHGILASEYPMSISSISLDCFDALTGGLAAVPDDWASVTALRALYFLDPALIWLDLYGNQHGFARDPEEYSFLNWIGEIGRQFEDAWVKN